MTWHAGADSLDAYLDGRLDDASASSVEAHLLACATCRVLLAQRAPTATIATSWASIEHRIDAEPRHAADRVLSRAGIPDHDIRLLAPTLSLRLSWLGAVALTLVTAALLVPDTPRGMSVGTLVFLTLATLTPVAGVAVALGSVSDPAPEMAAVTPITRWHQLGLRVITVLAASICIGLLAGLFLPGPWTRSGLWLFPSLALCALAVVLSGRFGAARAAAGVSLVWCAGVAVWAARTGDRLAPFRPGPQLVYLSAAALVVALIVHRPHLLESRRATRPPTPWSSP